MLGYRNLNIFNANAKKLTIAPEDSQEELQEKLVQEKATLAHKEDGSCPAVALLSYSTAQWHVVNNIDLTVSYSN